MKYNATAVLVLFVIVTALGQNVNSQQLVSYVQDSVYNKPAPNAVPQFYFELKGTYLHPVKQSRLLAAKSLGDLSAGYPKNWLKEYVSAEIKSNHQGKFQKATSANDRLTAEQTNMIRGLGIEDEIFINVDYKSMNAVTEKTEIRSMNYSMTVVPETEAEFIGGFGSMKKYFRENVINPIAAANPENIRQSKVRFTVNPDGSIGNTRVIRTSGDPETDTLIMNRINRMPKWKPAQNLQGVKIKQDFEFILYTGNEGC